MQRIYGAGGGEGCANLTFSALSDAQREMFARTIKTPSLLQQRDLDQEKRQIKLKNRMVDIEIKVAREDFPLIQAKLAVSYFESTPQEAWSKLESDICKSLGIEFIHSILERGDKAPIFRIIGLKNGGDYLVRQRENSAVLEVLNTGKPPVEISWEVTRNIVGVQKDLAFGARQHPVTCIRIASLVNRPMTNTREFDIRQKILSAQSAAEVISLLTSVYLPGVDQADPQFGIMGLLIQLNDIEQFKDNIDIISLHRLGMEQFDRLVYRGQAPMVIKEGLTFILRLLKELIREVDIAAVAIKVLSDTVVQHVDHKEQVFHAILNVMQTHCPPSPAHRPRKPKRLGNIAFTNHDNAEGQVEYKFQENNYFDPKKGVKQAVLPPGSAAVDINRFTRYSQVTSLDKDHSRHRKVTNIIESITQVIEFDSKGQVITPRTKRRLLREQEEKLEAARLKKEKDKHDAEIRRQLAQERLLEKDRSLMLQLISEEEEDHPQPTLLPPQPIQQAPPQQQPLVLINNRERLPPSMANKPLNNSQSRSIDEQEGNEAAAVVAAGRIRRLSFHDASNEVKEEVIVPVTAAADEDDEFDRQEEAIISAAKDKKHRPHSSSLRKSKSRSPSARRRSSAGSIRSAGAMRRGSHGSNHRLGNDSSTSRAGSASVSHDDNMTSGDGYDLDASSHTNNLPALTIDRRDSLSSYYQTLQPSISSRLQSPSISASNNQKRVGSGSGSGSRPPSLPSSPLHHRKRLLLATTANSTTNINANTVEEEEAKAPEKKANKPKFIIKRSTEEEPKGTNPSAASLAWSGSKGSIGKRFVPEELKLTKVASAAIITTEEPAIVLAAANTEPPSSEVLSSLPSTRPASAAVTSSLLGNAIMNSTMDSNREDSRDNHDSSGLQKVANGDGREVDMGVQSWVPPMPHLSSLHLPSSMPLTNAGGDAITPSTVARVGSSGGGNPHIAAIKKAKKTFAKLKLQPLPVVPCHTIRAFDLQDPAFVVLIQGCAGILQMLLLTYGHREWAFNNGLVAELAEMILCVPGIPRVLEYFVQIVETLYREGFGDPFEFINEVMYTQDDDPTMVISTVNGDHSTVRIDKDPPMVVFDTISEMSLPMIDKDCIWSRPVNDISGNNEEKAAALEKQLAEEVKAKNSDVDVKEVVMVGQQVKALPHKDSPRSVKAIAPATTAAVVATAVGDGMAAIATDGQQPPLIAAAAAAAAAAAVAAAAVTEKPQPVPMLSSTARQASLNTVQTTHTNSSNNTGSKSKSKKPLNTAVEGVGGIPLQHVSDARRNTEVMKAVGLSEFESRYVTCPSVHVITALSMCVYHVEVGQTERDLARYWLEFWFDGTREYMINVRKGKDLSGM